MTDHNYLSDAEASEMMDGILAEASDPMSPTVTPFLALGTNDPAMEMVDGPTTPQQAAAHDLWEMFRRP
ncbi:MAG: hypothetical protein WAP35_10220 [Solirubrobacterales bacterium]